MLTFDTEPGSAHPLGITTYPDGVNFSLFSQAATEVVLLLFDSATAIEPAQTIRFDPFRNKTFHFWHLFVRKCRPGTYYAFRVDGPDDPAAGHRFNPNKVLIGPYARGRDDVRRFVKGDPGLISAIASRVGASSDIYQARGQTPENSINFTTVHDGFTLNDLVSYNDKYNLANGEGNRDGIDQNLSWNCGVEGPTNDPTVLALRTRQINSPGFDDPDGRALACTIAGIGGTSDLHVIMNMFWEPLTFQIPAYCRWHVAMDTFATAPGDIHDSGDPPTVTGHTRTVQGRSIVVLTSGK